MGALKNYAFRNYSLAFIVLAFSSGNVYFFAAVSIDID